MPSIVNDLIELDRRAVEASLVVVSRVGRADLSRPTPCSDWTLSDLLAHMTAQHRGFRAASLGLGADPLAWQVTEDADPVAAHLAAAADLLRSFAEPGVLDQPFALPEISAETTFPGRRAVGFHVVDYVVHGWDVARSLGEPYAVDDELAEASLWIAQQVPNGPERLRPDASFRPSLPTVPASGGAHASAALDLTLRLLGRSP